MKISVIAIAFALLAARAADVPPARLWKGTEFGPLAKTLATKMDETKSGMQPLLQGPGFSMIFFHREGSGNAEVHEKLADFLVVKEGEGAVIVGGRVIAPKSTAPGEIRGTGIEGGTQHTLAVGDIIYIPANTPHQMIVAAGRRLDAAVIKVGQ